MVGVVGVVGMAPMLWTLTALLCYLYRKNTRLCERVRSELCEVACWHARVTVMRWHRPCEKLRLFSRGMQGS